VFCCARAATTATPSSPNRNTVTDPSRSSFIAYFF
jgi:hypothetical protein